MRVTGADHTSFTVSNLDRSLAFYVDLLGCEILWRRNEITSQLCNVPRFRAERHLRGTRSHDPDPIAAIEYLDHDNRSPCPREFLT